MYRLLLIKAICLVATVLFARQGYAQEFLKRTFQGGDGRCELLDGSQHAGKIRLRESQIAEIEVWQKGKAQPMRLPAEQIKNLTVGRDTFVVMRNIWVPRYKQKLMSYAQDSQDTMLIAQALVQRHINRGGMELLRYVGTMVETNVMAGGGGFSSNEYYCCYLFRRNNKGAYRTIAGESMPLKEFFVPIVADKPAVRDYLAGTTFVELKLPRVVDIYLISKGY